MKLYATITDERVAGWQEGEEFMIEIKRNNREAIARIKAIRAADGRYVVQVFPVLYPDVLKIETLGMGYATRINAETMQKAKYCTSCGYVEPQWRAQCIKCKKPITGRK